MEIWDLYSREGLKLDKTCIRGDLIPKEEFHLVVHIIIKNSKGDYLIQKRAETKDLWPGQWAFTGGSAIEGEDSETAALRELGEETGILLDKGDLKLMSRLHYDDYFSDIYFAEVDVDVTSLDFQVEEVSALDYLSQSDIQVMLDKGTFHYYRDDYLKVVFNI